MIEICRCENALLSALSMSWTRTPSARRLLAVDRQCQLQPAGIAVAGNVGDALDRLHALGDDRRPFLQQIEIGRYQRVLVVGIALPAAGADVLRGEHEEADAGHGEQACAQPVDHDLGRHAVALLRRLQADEHGAAVGGRRRRAPPPPPTVEPMPATAGSCHHDVGEPLLQAQHRLERDIGRCARRADDEAAIVGREIALRAS